MITIAFLKYHYKSLKICYIFILVLISSSVFASGTNGKGNPYERKITEATRITTPPKIDGILDEKVWSSGIVITDFIQYSPYNGKPATNRSEVRFFYDDFAIYVGAIMYDSSPDSIFVELGERDADRLLNADNFSIEICPYNDGVNGFRFKVSASGVQSDSRVEANEFGRGGGGGGGGMGGGMMNRQDSWDAVWLSNVSLNEKGWTAEIRIPYSALRFPREPKQKWGINFWREVKRTRELSSWNYVNRDIGSTIVHLGEINNISDIKPPVRLSLTPYLAGYIEKYSENKTPSFIYNGGLDIKYGINESFTIDATLVPDFGQVQSDDKILNLTPYEVKYNEKRPFFMEGTELFNKGDIFYSRRIGTKPRMYYDAYDDLQINESVILNPQESELLNATKFSGRTRQGLGIGVFNGMTKEMYATIRDSVSGLSRSYKTEPFTNFNMLVFDQSLKNNSYISLSNTNVWRSAEKDLNYYTANVTATDFNLQTSSKLYSVSGKAALSQKYYKAESDFGHSYNLRLGKTGGSLRAEYTLNAISDTYDPNDMGYLRRNNEFSNTAQISYIINKPFWKILNTRNSFNYSFSQLYYPRVFTETQLSLSSFTTFNNFWSVNMRAELTPLGSNDYYEPREKGRFYHKGSDIMTMLWFDTNRTKKFYINVMGIYTNIWSDYSQKGYMISLTPSFRFSNRFSVNHQFNYSAGKNDIGYVSKVSSTEIYFGKREIKSLTNTLSAGYIFTANSYVSFRMRHYWSVADYGSDFYLLKNDGRLNPTNAYTQNPDNNFNTFNIDMVYTWRFSPGSEMTLVWKNSIYSSGDIIFSGFGENLNNMFDSPAANSISLKILYYLDYQSLKKRK